ncbi:DNA polymerase delta small subunit Cdc1 [Taxawa tesnikishii (nom. ined.)]|nr:DNA polymerase delta small subunit Cdc1 [Dothideales sp. JES 119]
MLEDESGRLRLTGSFLDQVLLVTGCIVAVMGTENADGDFEVIDIQVPDLARQPQRWERDEGDAAVGGKAVMQKKEKAGKIAIVSGLGISGDAGDTMTLDLLMEYLLGKLQRRKSNARLLGREDMANRKTGPKKYGYDMSTYNAAPTDCLDLWLSTLLPSIPITLLPGESDPTQTAVPQQPIHPALFPHSRTYMAAPDAEESGWFDSTTNPWEGDVDGWRIMATGGQPVDDVFKYVEGEDRIQMMEAMMRWRLGAPTAPDTLWCYPFQDADPFVIKSCPHVYVVGNQPKFDTTVIEGPNGQSIRLITVPCFKETGELLLLDAETLDVEVVKFDVFGNA